MAKAAKKAKATKKAAKKTAAKTGVTRAPARHEDDHIDGCLCAMHLPEDLYTRDEDLPAAKGGVASR
jgi:hypothetical protein